MGSRFSSPNQVPFDDIANDLDLNIICPYWMNIGIYQTSSNVWYQLYDSYDINYMFDERVKMRLNAIGEDIRNTTSETDFKPILALVVTWDNVSPGHSTFEVYLFYMVIRLA